jgi:hypothetical protein
VLIACTGSFNTGVGSECLKTNGSGTHNVGVGYNALLSTTNSNNTCIGSEAGKLISTGNFNVCLGRAAGQSLTTGTGNIIIGSINAAAATTSDSCYIDKIRGKTTASADAIAVLIDSAGQLGTTSSLRELKDNIVTMQDTTDIVKQLNPCTFNYKCHSAECQQYGLIYDEVLQILPNICVKDNEHFGTIQYQYLPMINLRTIQSLINRVETLEKEIDNLKK